MNWLNHPGVGDCAEHLRRGQVIAYPTEAVWGLGCDPFNEEAVLKILSIKKRPWQKGLILIAGDMSQVEFLLQDLSTSEREQLEQTWPGHNTWLMKHHGLIPWYVCGTHDTVAVRVTVHPVVKALCEQFGGPIVSTSANPAGLPPARNGTKARQYFSREGINFCPGVVGSQASPSTIKNLHTGETLR